MNTLFTGICEDMQALQARYGETLVCTPLIDIAPVEDPTPLQKACAQIERYDYLLLTSRFAVRHVMPLLSALPPNLRVVSIGDTTTEALHELGVEQVEQVHEDNRYGVVAWFERQPRGRILFPRSSIAPAFIVDFLRALGYEVDALTAYINRMPAQPEKVDLQTVERIVFTAPSTVVRFVKLYGALPADKELVARGPITQHAIEQQLKKQ